MVRRVPFIAGLIASLAAAGAATGQAPPAEPPAATGFPPPSPMNEDGVKAWVLKYIDTAGWHLLGADPAAASFLSAEGVSVGTDGFLSSEVRREYFGAPQLGPNGSRSVRQAWVVDCKGKKVWVRKIMLFPESNLKGQAVSRENPEPKWTEVSSGSINEKLMIAICAAPSGGKVQPPQPKTPT
jgi:hypothetical protein